MKLANSILIILFAFCFLAVPGSVFAQSNDLAFPESLEDPQKQIVRVVGI